MAVKEPKELKEVKGEWLIAWAIENNQVKWLQEQFKANSKEVKGKMVPNIARIRLNWAKEFKPTLIPAAKPKRAKKTLYEQVMGI